MKSSRPALVRALVALFLPLTTLPLAAQEPASTAIDVDALEVTLTGKAQTFFNTTDIDGEQPSELRMRRVTLETIVKASDFVSGRIGLGFAGGRVALKNAYVDLSFSPAFRVRTGNAKVPFSLLELTSATRMSPIERGALIRGIEPLEQQNLLGDYDYSGRQVGVQVLGAPVGAPLGLSYTAAVFRGPLTGDIGARDSYGYAARVVLTPARELAVAAGWSNRDFAGPGAPETAEIRRGNAFEADLEYGSYDPGVHVIAQASTGTVDPFLDSDFVGATAWLAYRTTPITEIVSGLEPTFRVSHGDVDALVGRGGTLFTPGVNVYIGGLNRIMLDYDYWRAADGGSDARSLKMMFQLAF